MKITVIDKSTDNGEYFTFKEWLGSERWVTKVLFNLKKSDIPF